MLKRSPHIVNKKNKVTTKPSEVKRVSTTGVIAADMLSYWKLTQTGDKRKVERFVAEQQV